MQLLWTVVTYLFTTNMLNMELNMMLIVLIEFVYIRFDEYLPIQRDDEFDSLLVCNIIRFFFICLHRDKFLSDSRILGSIGIK